MWDGDYLFLLKSFVQKDFRTRYRNMSLGVFWSLLNPLVMMLVLTFVFRVIRQESRGPVFFLCGLIPFNFMALAWSSGTTIVIDNANLIKRVSIPREILPVAGVLGHAVHLTIQFVLLLLVDLALGGPITRYWLVLPLLWLGEVVFVCGCVLLFSALDVFIRDMRYLVDSAAAVLFWLTPVTYATDDGSRFSWLYQYNPIAAVITALRDVVLDGRPPRALLLTKLCAGAVAVFSLGWLVFRRLGRRFYDYL